MATTPVFLPGKSHGQRGLPGYSPWGHKRIRTIDLTNNNVQEDAGSVLIEIIPLICILTAYNLGRSPSQQSSFQHYYCTTLQFEYQKLNINS